MVGGPTDVGSGPKALLHGVLQFLEGGDLHDILGRLGLEDRHFTGEGVFPFAFGLRWLAHHFDFHHPGRVGFHRLSEPLK